MFYSYLFNAIVFRGKEKMSARWRRIKRNTERFSIFKSFHKTKNKRIIPDSDLKNLGKKRVYRTYKIPKIDAEKKTKEPEPLIDVLDEKDEIIVVAELAGFNSEDSKIHVKDQRLILSTATLGRKYYKSLNLPKRVIPSTIRTTYKNGVLEIRLRKVNEEKTIDKMAG
jgi:HSP20 family molecular chaperone IbpA